MNDDDLLDRLRRAAADVPPSTLDLTAVLRSARRKRTRHRTVVASGCVAAVAGVGAVAPALPGLLPPGPVADVAAAALSTEPCPSTPIVTLSSAQSAPAVRYAEKVEVAADGVTDREVAVPFVGGLRLDAGDAPAVVREEILDAARTEDRQRPDEDGSHGMPGDEGRDVGRLTAFDGVIEAESEGSRPRVPTLDVEPGVYVVLDEGRKHTIHGMARCGTELWTFTLSYRTHETAALLDCGATVDDGLEWAIKDLACPDGVTEADDEVVGLDAALAQQLRRLVAGEG
jgi:hypothetical protein